MNSNLLKMALSSKNRKTAVSTPHLWTILEDLSKTQSVIREASPDVQINGEVTIQFSDKGKRVRKVVRRSNHRMTGKYPSIKNGRMVHWESQYEKQAIQLLEVNPSVTSYAEQAAIFKYSNGDGVTYKHIPDIYVELYNGNRVFIEVKPNSAIHDQDLINRTLLLRELLQRKGYTYFLIVPDQLDEMHYLKNAKSLIRRASKAVPFFIKEKIQKYLRVKGQVHLSKLIQMIDDENALGWIYKLLINGLIKCNLAEPISAKTTITLN